MTEEEKLQQLKAEAEKCKRCRLHKSRSKVVFGVGPADAKIVLVGEAPGFMEDKSGFPFVGAAGKNLDMLLQTAGLKRENVYITNVVLCRPPDNRAPLDDEIETCTTNYLQKQLAIIKPKFVIAMGRTAARALSGRSVVMEKEHGGLLDCTYAGVKFRLFITYHPAAALYGAEAKQKLKMDFKKLGQIIKSIG
jgi:uracil-DNA glycosylase family 4